MLAYAFPLVIGASRINVHDWGAESIRQDFALWGFCDN